MVKMIVIFTIVFVYYCEINAEIHYLQNKATATEDFQQNPLETEKDHADIERTKRRARKETETNRHTTGSREDSSDLSEFVQSDNEAHINMFFKPGVAISRKFNKSGEVNSRRFNIKSRVEENTETNELDNERIKPKSSKKYHHHLRKKKGENKKHKKHAHNEGKEIHKKDEKYMEDNDSSSGSSSSEKLHTQKKRFNIKDRHGMKKTKHAKATSMSHEIDKKKQVKEKSKDKKGTKRMDKAKRVIHRLYQPTDRSKNDKRNETKQLKGKKRRKHNVPREKNKSTDALSLAEVLIPAEFKTTIKDMKPPQRNILEKKPTITKSKKPNSTHQLPKVKKNMPGPPLFRAHRDHKRPGTNLRHHAYLLLDYDGGRTQLSPYSITTQMNLLMKEFPEANVTVTKLAHTMEYNDITLVTIRGVSDNARTSFRARESKYIDDVPEKKIIFIVHGLTVMGLKYIPSLIYVTEFKLLMSYYLKHLDKFDFMVMPLANPDGYSASLSADHSIWNKNTSPQDVCSGVFLDRNFDVSWSNSHVISSCSQLYPGPSAFSEEESKAVRDVLHHYSHKILAYIHVHAGTLNYDAFKGEAVLYPKGYTFTQSDDDKYIDMKGEIDEAMKNASFRVVTATVDTLANWYGIVRGTSVDYAATVYGIPYALEFVMQSYDSGNTTNCALTEIWSRVIDATFNNIWKNLQRGVDARRKPIHDYNT